MCSKSGDDSGYPLGACERRKDAMSDLAKLFLQYDYPETKDLCKHFLTLVTAVLVFSLAFSEKIVNFPTAPKPAKRLLLSAWCSMIGAIIVCGVGLCFITMAAGEGAQGAGVEVDIPLEERKLRAEGHPIGHPAQASFRG
jgi:hypothetical protein